MSIRLPVILVFLSFGIVSHTARADPNALWRIVHDQCEPNYQQFRTPVPCLELDQNEGAALLKDRVGASQTLLIPTARITGIEDAAVLEPDAPNYFALAWGFTNVTSALAGAVLSRDALSLAINSRFGRTQSQLHIHIDCVRPDIRTALAQHLDAVRDSWTSFPIPLAGNVYQARRVLTLNRPGETPFQLVASGLPGASRHMDAITIVVVGASFDREPGFVLLAGTADPENGDRGSGEELQDHSCALAREK